MNNKLDNAFKMAEAITKKVIANKNGGYVYVIINWSFKDWVKVGVAKDLSRRLSTYQTSSPYRDYRYHFTLAVDDTRTIEKDFKDHLIGKERKDHEWYLMTPNRAKEIILEIVS